MPPQNTIENFFNNYDVLIICLTDISLQRCEDPVSKTYANVNIFSSDKDLVRKCQDWVRSFAKWLMQVMWTPAYFVQSGKKKLTV